MHHVMHFRCSFSRHVRGNGRGGEPGTTLFFFVIWMFYDVLGFGWGGHLAVR